MRSLLGIDLGRGNCKSKREITGSPIAETSFNGATQVRAPGLLNSAIRITKISYMKVSNNRPDFLLFAQHGWADNGNTIGKLAQALANPETHLVVPSLGILKTFIHIELLLEQVEAIAAKTINKYPQIPLRIIGHSMGGLIWLEVLERHPEWWHMIHSLTLIGSPVGGSDLARIIDPLGIGIGTAKALGKNRRPIAEKIAQHIPTLSIASNLNSGSDGLVTIECSKIAYARFALVSGIHHTPLRCHPRIVPIIQEFWQNPQVGSPPGTDLATKAIRRLQSVPGMTDASYRDFERSQVVLSFADGMTLRTWKNPLGINHVFLADRLERCLYAGYVGWIHANGLCQAIKEMKKFDTATL